MSSTSLAQEISALVSRSLRGESVDSAAAGEELAARYPDLGMTGELIAKAIARAASMMRAVQTGEAVEQVSEDIVPPVELAAFFAAPADAEDPAVDAGEYDAPPPHETAPQPQRFAEVPAGLFRRAARA